jgi:tetratricopeptide (TPR) repeat protein
VSLERIEITPFAVIAGEILQQRRTGSLTIVHAPLRRNLYFAQGELALITSATPEDSLADFLVRRGVMTADRALPLAAADPLEAAARFHESGLLDMSSRQTLLREWMTLLFVPLFSLDEGTAAFTDAEAIEPDKRVFLQSMPAVVLDGIRGITNGLVLRRSLGDLKRSIERDDTTISLDAVPLTDAERTIAEALNEPQTIETFLKQFTADSVTAARVVIAMMTLGLFSVVTQTRAVAAIDDSDMHRDLELLAAIGSNDQRSLRAVALSRQLPSMDHYQLLEIPRAAMRGAIVHAADQKKHEYNVSTFPPVVKDALAAINKRITEAAAVLENPARRSAYDKLLDQRTGRGGADELQRRATQRSIANQNFQRARELSTTGDYYGAIVLLKQTVNFAPDHAEAWHLLGACQERNPKWRRDAAESFQRALSLDPNSVEVLISLGDLYRTEGLISRAQSCYEDVLKIAADHPEAKSRLAGIRKK